MISYFDNRKLRGNEFLPSRPHAGDNLVIGGVVNSLHSSDANNLDLETVYFKVALKLCGVFRKRDGKSIYEMNGITLTGLKRKKKKKTKNAIVK